MNDVNVLWVDDEIELLRPHIIFLERKGYTVHTSTNADDALDLLEKRTIDLIFLDEMMPGMSGLEALSHFKRLAPSVPIVMLTKSEEESVMDRAVGANISDYLIKPVNPNQMLITLKKHLHGKDLVTTASESGYRTDYSNLAQQINAASTISAWIDVYRQLCDWRMSLLKADTLNMLEMHSMQQLSANSAFAKYIRREYEGWFPDGEGRPLMSPSVLRERVFPVIDSGEKVLLVVIDNMRYDQWRVIRGLLGPRWRVEAEELYCAILPTVTQYARNALFAGLMPLEIERLHPDLWVGELDEEGKNIYEYELLKRNIQRSGRRYKTAYYKGATLEGTPLAEADLGGAAENDLTVMVYNFIDMLSHSRSNMQIIKQLATDSNAYLSLTESWFRRSDLLGLINRAAEHNMRLVITTDHGSIQVRQAIRVVGDRETSTNMRYKMGRNLAYDKREVVDFVTPSAVHLPQNNVSSRYIFAKGNDFLVYPKIYNYYATNFRDSFQHGGVSLEEMLVPVVTLRPL